VLISFFECKGIVQWEFVPPGQTANQKFYLPVLERLKQWVHCVRPELFLDKWILCHDNTPSHTVLSTKEFLVKQSIVVLEHPTYLPDVLAPCDFLLFRTMNIISGITFWNHERGSEGCSGRSKQLAGEWLLEMLQQLEMTLKFMYNCTRELLWRRPLQFRIKFNTVLPVSTVLLFNCQTSYIQYIKHQSLIRHGDWPIMETNSSEISTFVHVTFDGQIYVTKSEDKSTVFRLQYKQYCVKTLHRNKYTRSFHDTRNSDTALLYMDTDILEEITASSATLKTEVICSSKLSVTTYKTTIHQAVTFQCKNQS
jgi:hypothetical protein